MNIENAIKKFKEYTDNYKDISERCILKIDHTFRVMNLCEKIATSLNLTEEEIYLSQLCGLLHDIGRFEQWKNYETFNDIKSIDHGDLGYEILKKNIKDYCTEEKYYNIILNSVKYHNKFDIPNNLTDKEKLFLKITRDADKIDILYLYTINKTFIDTNNESFSDNIYNTLINHKSIMSKMKETKADTLSVSFGFIFDINFIKSYEIIRNNKYYDKMVEIYKNNTTNNKFKEQLEDVNNNICEYIKEKVKC